MFLVLSRYYADSDFFAVVIEVFCLNSVFDVCIVKFLMKQVDTFMHLRKAFFHRQFKIKYCVCALFVDEPACD